MGMPSIGTEPLSEKAMWGATFFDQLACRIAFRKLRYEGEFTALTTEAIHSPALAQRNCVRFLPG